MRMQLLCGPFLMAQVMYASCGAPEVAVHFRETDDYTFSGRARRAIQRIADATAREVRPLLPDLSQQLVLHVEPRAVVNDTGETAHVVGRDAIYWTIDPEADVVELATTRLRAVLFHSWHHLVRGWPEGFDPSVLEGAVSEGLALAFERDFAGVSNPWGEYPADVSDWADEILALPRDAPWAPWLRRHPDGRRQVGPKVGTYWVDRAMQASGKSAAELVRASADEILRMAGVERPSTALSQP